MKRLWKEYPVTVVLIVLYTLMIPVSIILYFVLGATRLDKGMLVYGTPVICVSMILFFFEVFAVKHDDGKDDKT